MASGNQSEEVVNVDLEGKFGKGVTKSFPRETNQPWTVQAHRVQRRDPSEKATKNGSLLAQGDGKRE